MPSSPSRSVVKIETFKGVDLNSSPSNVEIYRSPNAPNMMRDVPGKIKKRTGYEVISRYEGRINGRHLLRLPEKELELIHAGNKLYCGESVLSEEMADKRSVSFQIEGKLYLLDGKQYLCFRKMKRSFL